MEDKAEARWKANGTDQRIYWFHHSLRSTGSYVIFTLLRYTVSIVMGVYTDYNRHMDCTG